MIQEKVRVGMTGIGGIGTRHLTNLSNTDHVELVGVHDLIPRSASDAAKAFGTVAYQSLEELVGAGLDALMICSPPSAHLSAVRLAAEHGMHVFCEKPMSASMDECKQMIDLCRRHDVKLVVGLKKQFDPYYAASKRIFDEAGDPPLFATVEFLIGRGANRDWFWQEAGGPVIETAVHMYDMLEAWFGPVERVFAEGGTFFLTERAPIPDAAVATFRFRSGGVAMMSIGCATGGSLRREVAQVTSSRYVVRVDGGFDNPNRLEWVDMTRRLEANVVSIDGVAPGSGLKEELEHFIEAIRLDRDLLVTGENGLRAVAIGLAIRESIETGKPVEIS